ncbi:hypothetical protein [Nonomuraea typhae]|uniref:Uncharacterized protein n=1 Tax=Nonomuraea typhae TaxID=2603600 RepID=A0ABW7Z7I9_9ACTN
MAASVQPRHAADDPDVAGLHRPGRTGRAFPPAGARTLLGSHAPPDPWVSIASAVSRAETGKPAAMPAEATVIAGQVVHRRRRRLPNARIGGAEFVGITDEQR